MKGSKLTLGALAALSMAMSSGCQILAPQVPKVAQVSAKAEKSTDHLEVRYYRVTLADTLAKDVSWTSVSKELSGEPVGTVEAERASMNQFMEVSSRSGGKLQVTGATEQNGEMYQSGPLNQEVSPEALVAALSKQGKVDQIGEGSYANVLKSTDVEGLIQGRVQQKRYFTPNEQCTPDGATFEASDTTVNAKGYWLTAFRVRFKPMVKSGTSLPIEVHTTVISEGKVPDCDDIGGAMGLTILGKKESTYGHSAYLKLGQSSFMSGLRARGMHKSLAYIDPKTKPVGAADTWPNEVLVVLLTPSMN